MLCAGLLSSRSLRQLHSKMEQIIAPTISLNNGKKFPVFGLGTYQAGPGEVEQTVKDAIDVGYRHIDTAMFYRNEKEIGSALKEVFQQGKVKREELFITSKLWNSFHRPELVEGACRKTVSDLGLDYVDLYLIHWPVSFKVGDALAPMDAQGNFLTEDVDITETYKAMEKCVQLGLAKSIGVSNFNSEQLTRILEVATIKPVVNQVECHPYLQQRKLIEFCSERGITVTAYCPLGAPGRISPRRRTIIEDDTLQGLAKKYDKTIAQVILRFLVQIGAVPIPKTVNKHRLLENINIFNFELSREDIALIQTLDSNSRVVGFDAAKHDKDYPFSAEF